jgi:hypothetical protein
MPHQITMAIFKRIKTMLATLVDTFNTALRTTNDYLFPEQQALRLATTVSDDELAAQIPTLSKLIECLKLLPDAAHQAKLLKKIG